MTACGMNYDSHVLLLDVREADENMLPKGERMYKCSITAYGLYCRW